MNGSGASFSVSDRYPAAVKSVTGYNGFHEQRCHDNQGNNASRLPHVMKNILIVLLLASIAVAQAQDQQSTKPDNTKKNATEKVTAEEQGGSASDRGLTKNIRREIVKNESLSAMAKNIKVITIDGKVTLKGPVHSEQEKTAIAAIAENVAGKGKVNNHLEVKKSH